MSLSFHYLLMANQAMLHKELLNALSDTPLSMGQPKILEYLTDHDGASQKEIAKGCHIEPPTLSTLLNRMEEFGLITRRSQNNNRRTLYVYLTDDGKKYGERINAEFKKIEEAVFEGFNEREKNEFTEKFNRIYDNMKKKRGLL